MCAAPGSASARPDEAPGPPPTFVWRALPVGAGGWITGIEVDPSGTTWLARTDTYGAYRWDSERSRWLQIVNSDALGSDPSITTAPLGVGVESLAVAPGQPNRVYMAFAGAVWRSDDGARHFVRTALSGLRIDANGPGRTRGERLAVSRLQPDVVLYGAPASGLMRTTDGGRRWQRVASVDVGSRADVLIWADPARPGRMIAFVDGGEVYESADDGESFRPLGRSPRPASIHRATFVPDGGLLAAAPDGLWLLAGDTWRRLEGASRHRWAAVAINPRSGAYYAITEGGGVFRSVDRGARWQSVATATATEPGDVPWLAWKDNAWLSIATARFDPLVPDRLWIAEGSGVWYADLNENARNLTWQSRARGIEQLVATDVRVMHDRSVVLSAWDFGIHRKSAHELNDYSTRFGPSRRFNSAWHLDLSPADPRFVVASVADHRQCCAGDGQSVMSGWSIDGGRTWTRFASLPADPSRPARRVAFGNIAVSAGSTDNMVWLPADDMTPWYTRDRGRTWTQVTLRPGRGAEPGSYAAFYLRRVAMIADPVLRSTFYYLHSGAHGSDDLAGIWRSDDGGVGWERLHEGSPAPHSMYNARLAAVPGVAGDLYFTPGPLDGLPARLLHSRNGGRAWAEVPDVLDVSAIGFDRNLPVGHASDVYIAGRVRGRYGIWQGRPAGGPVSWRMIGRFPAGSLDRVNAIDVDRTDPLRPRVYLAMSGSGWVIGEAAACAARPYRSEDTDECFLVRP